MAQSSLVDALVRRWRYLQRAGQTISAEQLCQDYPELLPEVEQRLQAENVAGEADAGPAEEDRPHQGVPSEPFRLTIDSGNSRDGLDPSAPVPILEIAVDRDNRSETPTAVPPHDGPAPDIALAASPAFGVGGAFVRLVGLLIMAVLFAIPICMVGAVLGCLNEEWFLLSVNSLSIFLAALAWSPDRRLFGFAPPLRSVHALLIVLMALPLAVLGRQVSVWTGAALGWDGADLQPAAIFLSARPPLFEALEARYVALAQLPLLLAFLAGCLLPALGEELFFRGFLGRGLIARYGAVWGILSTSLLFGLVHIDPLNIGSTALLGIMLHGVYLATRTYWAPVLLHVVNNMLALGALRDNLESHIYFTGPRQGLLLTTAALAVAGLLWALYKTRTTWQLPNGEAWSPGYVSAEQPPAGLDAVAQNPPVRFGSILATAGTYLAFAAVAVLLLADGLLEYRANRLIEEGNSHFDRGEFDRARAAYDEAIRLAPRGVAGSIAHFNRGLAWFRAGQADKALPDFDQAILLDPKRTDAFAERGRLYGERGAATRNKADLRQAIADCDEVLRRKPTDTYVLNTRGLAWTALGEHDKAHADFTEVIRLEPRSAEAYSNRGRLWANKFDFDKMIDDYGMVIALEPNNPDGYKNRAYARHRKLEFDKALDDYDQVIRLRPRDAWGFANRGLVFLAKGDPAAAIPDLTQALSFTPDDAMVLTARGKAHLLTKSYDQTIADCSAARRLGASTAGLYGDRGWAYFKKGDLDNAFADLDEAVGLDPLNGTACSDRGRVRIARKEFDKGSADLEEGLRLHSHNPWNHNNLAWFLATCPEAKYRNGPRAIELARKAVALDKNNEGEMLATLAAALAETGDFTEAVRCQEKALNDANYVHWEGDRARQRLELFRKKQPCRE